MALKGSTKDSRKKERTKKPNELLSSVVRETAPSAALELLRENERFAMPSGTAWAMLLLDTNVIGGLSAKHNKDADKGMLIQLIASDQIQTVATETMLSEEVFGIIPTRESLERMDEYQMLTQAEYSWGVVWEKDGLIEIDQVAPATFAQADKVVSGLLSLKDALGEAGADAWAEHSGEVATGDADSAEAADPMTEAIEQVETTAPAVELGDEGDPLFGGNPGEVAEFEEAPMGAEAEWIPEDEDLDESGQDGESFEGDVPVYGSEPADESYLDEDETESYVDDDVVIASQDDVLNTLVRRFLTEDLDLGLDLDEFNKTFAIGAPLVQIDLPEGSSQWLGDQISHLTNQANASLEQLHRQGEDAMRVEFVKLMSLHAEQVAREVSVDRDGSRYKALTEVAESTHSKKLNDKEERIRAEQLRISEKYEQTAREVGEQAAADATLKYKERHKTKLHREQLEVVTLVNTEIEDDYSRDRQEILRVRRLDAGSKMELGTTAVFGVLQEIHELNADALQEMLVLWTEKIQAVIADHRGNDVSRVSVLAEDHARFNQVEELNEHQARVIESMEVEQSDRVRRMEQEMERVRESAVKDMQLRDAEWQHELDLQRERTDAANVRADQAREQMSLQAKSEGERRDARFEELEESRNNMSLELERSEYQQVRFQRLMTLLLIAVPLLALGAGFLFAVLMLG